MAYHTEQRLPIPKQSTNKLRSAMLITAKERNIASKSQLKDHAHHYFVSQNRNAQDARCGYNDTTREFDDIAKLSHAESMMALTTLSPLDTVHSNNYGGSETSRSLPVEQQFTSHQHKDKLPAIVNINTRKQPIKSQKDNSWLGPPNSIPPNKRSEHVAAYKTQTYSSTRLVSHETESVTNTEVQSESETIVDVQPLLIDRFPHSNRYYGYHHDDDDDSSASLYPSDISDGADTFSIHSDTHFTQLRLIDKPFSKHFSTPGTSLQLKSLAASTRFDDASERYSNNGAYMHQYGESISDSQSSANSLDTRRKRVHFDPKVREVSRENRSAPLVANRPPDQPSYLGGFGVGGRSAGGSGNVLKVSLDMTRTSDTTVDQLPAVVEKFTIKSLPVLPNINRGAINFTNANVIYIKGDGKTPGKVSAPRPVFIHKNNVIDTSRSSNMTSQSGSSHVRFRVHQPPKTYSVTAVPQLSSLTEESSNPSLSPSPQLKNNKQQPTKLAPPPPQQKVVPASTSANTPNTSQHSTTSTSNTQSKSSTTKKITPKKATKLDAKKATSTKSKSKGRKGRSSGSSSRNSPSMESPVTNDVMDEAELREQRQREYAAAMLAVQQRMREFDMRHGKNGDNFDDKDSSWFGKAIPPKSNTASKSKLSKPK